VIWGEFGDIGHSEEAKNILKKYIIGKLDSSSNGATKKTNGLREPKTKQTDMSAYALPIFFVIFAVTALVFAIIIAFKYNSVKVFNRKIRTQNISNTMWIIYYLTIGLRSSAAAVLYGVLTTNAILHGFFFISALILSAINAFTLCLALNHQRRYRSSAPTAPAPQGAAGSIKEGDPLLGKSDLLKKSISPAEIIFFILFAANLALFYAALREQGKNQKLETLLVLIFVGSYIAERLPVLILVLIIVAHRNGNEGPTRQSKVYLFLGAVLHLSSDLPIFFWDQILPGQCIILNSISYIDILTIVNFLALIFFFLFLRSEYLRNMEECIWTTVSQIQDTFDFRRF